jgi:uncharacterized protein (DUF885 family)
MSESRRFEGILDRYFEEWLADDPVAATYAGLRTGEGKPGRRNRGMRERGRMRAVTAVRALEEVNPRALKPEQQLDRLALRSRLLRELEDHERGSDRLNPDAPEALMNLLLHELQRGEEEPARARANLRSLLKAAPDHLREAASIPDRPERVWTRVMRDGCAGAGSLLGAVSTFLGGEDELVGGVGKAIDGYRDRVLGRSPAPAGSFAIGAARLQRRVRDELGLDYTLGEIESLASAEAERVGALLCRACGRHGKGRDAAAIIAEARAAWDPGEDLLGHYREVTRQVADGFKTANAVTFPGNESLVLRPVPAFMRHLFPTAAYSSPGAFERRQRGTFWVNDLSVTKRTEADRLAERQQHFGVSLTAGHEAYPGHHLQFVTANRHPRRWRRLFAHAVFYEGWTLWCEQMMVDLRIDRSPWTRIQQLHDALWRVHRILVDLRLQTGRYTYRQAVNHLREAMGFTAARAEAEINWYSMSPGVPMSYWLGRLENGRLHDRLVKGRGWSLRRFNDWLLGFGTLPQGWLERHGLD